MGWGSLLAREIRESEAAAKHNSNLDARRFAANQNRLERIALCLETLVKVKISNCILDSDVSDFNEGVEELRKKQNEIGL